MSYLISFTTNKFDVSKESPNKCNSINGESVLVWLREKLCQEGFFVTLPDHEDWGWYIKAEKGGNSYLVGASGESKRPPSDMDWIVQIHKDRSIIDKIFSRNKLTGSDELVVYVDRLIREEPDFLNVTVDWET